MNNDTMEQLVAMSNHLGRPELDYVILGEGNTSARADAESFYVKASGTELRTITARGFVQVSFARVLSLLDSGDLTDQEIKVNLSAAKVDPKAPGHPSVETLLHALCLNLPGVNFIGHTHPTAINALTCSVAFELAFSEVPQGGAPSTGSGQALPRGFAGRLFPDEIVLCGPAPVLVPYTDPGIPLARRVYELINIYMDCYGEQPKVILIQNHGLIALGRTAQQVEDITQMAVKTARILLGTYAAGGPRFLSQKDVDRIHTRPDELYRRQQLKLE